MCETRKLPLVALIIALVIQTSVWGQVPVNVSSQKVVSEGKVYYMHEVLKGQTLYSISKAYKVPINSITDANVIPEGGIQTGQILRIPVSATQEASQSGRRSPSQAGASRETVSPGIESPQIEISDQKIVSFDKVYYMHEVMKGQTLYSIAKAYKVTIIDITRENVIPSSGIYAGQVLKIPASSSLTLTEPDALPMAKTKEETPIKQENAAITTSEKEQAVANPAPKETKPAQTQAKNESETYRMHRVRKGETLYSISRDYNVTVGALIKVNDVPHNEIREGQILKIPAPDYEVITRDEPEPQAPPQAAEEPQQEAPVTKPESKEAVQPIEKTQQQAETQTQTSNREPEKKTAQPERKKIHKVQKGESLSDIAKKYGITVRELKDANKGVIFAMPNMKLVIPSNSEEENE